MANDAKKPRAFVPSIKRVQIAMRAQRCLLDGVFGIVFIPQERACESMRGIQMRLNDLVEAMWHESSVPRERNARPQTAPVRNSYGRTPARHPARRTRSIGKGIDREYSSLPPD